MSGRDIGAARTLPADGGNSREGSSVPLGNSLQPRVRLPPGSQTCRICAGPIHVSGGLGALGCIPKCPGNSPSEQPRAGAAPVSERRGKESGHVPSGASSSQLFPLEKAAELSTGKEIPHSGYCRITRIKVKGLFWERLGCPSDLPAGMGTLQPERGPGYKQIHIYPNSFLFPLGSTDWGNLPKASRLPLPAPEGRELVGIRAHVPQEKEEASKGLCPQR